MAVAASRKLDAPSLRWTEQLPDGSTVIIRSISPLDEQRERDFLRHLPTMERGYRFLGLIKDASGEGIARELTAVNPNEIVSLVAVTTDGGCEVEVGVASFYVDAMHAHCAVAVAPEWQRRGVGSALMRRLIEVARARGVKRMYSADAARCKGAHTLAERLGFCARPDPEDPIVTTFELRFPD